MTLCSSLTERGEHIQAPNNSQQDSIQPLILTFHKIHWGQTLFSWTVVVQTWTYTNLCTKIWHIVPPFVPLPPMLLTAQMQSFQLKPLWKHVWPRCQRYGTTDIKVCFSVFPNYCVAERDTLSTPHWLCNCTGTDYSRCSTTHYLPLC